MRVGSLDGLFHRDSGGAYTLLWLRSLCYRFSTLIMESDQEMALVIEVVGI